MKKTLIFIVLICLNSLSAQRTITIFPPTIEIKNDEQQKGWGVLFEVGIVDRKQINERLFTYLELYDKFTRIKVKSFIENYKFPLDYIEYDRGMDLNTSSIVHDLESVIEDEMDRLFSRKIEGALTKIRGLSQKKMRLNNEAYFAEHAPIVGNLLNCRYLLKFRATGYHFNRKKKFPRNLNGGFAFETIIVDCFAGKTVYYDLNWYGKKQVSRGRHEAPERNSDILNFNNPKEIKPDKLTKRIYKVLELAIDKWQMISI